MADSNIRFSEALEGFRLNMASRRLSKRTVSSYEVYFRKFQEFLDEDPLFADITTNHIKRFLASTPHLTNKTVLNRHITLSSLWTWAVDEGLAEKHIVRVVPRPKPEKREIVPYSRDDIIGMLESCEYTRSYTRPFKRECQNRRGTTLRDKSIILLLLDSGIRATELCNATLQDIDLKNRKLLVFGKGSKERSVPFSPRTAQAIWRYLQQDREQTFPNDNVFLTTNGTPFREKSLYRLISRIGQRAGVPRVTVHRFRHTFAISFLRNGGNAYILQMLLGHSTLDMTKRYLALAGNDAEAAHQLASPVANWRL